MCFSNAIHAHKIKKLTKPFPVLSLQNTDCPKNKQWYNPLLCIFCKFARNKLFASIAKHNNFCQHFLLVLMYSSSYYVLGKFLLSSPFFLLHTTIGTKNVQLAFIGKLDIIPIRFGVIYP